MLGLVISNLQRKPSVNMALDERSFHKLSIFNFLSFSNMNLGRLDCRLFFVFIFFVYLFDCLFLFVCYFAKTMAVNELTSPRLISVTAKYVTMSANDRHCGSTVITVAMKCRCTPPMA